MNNWIKTMRERRRFRSLRGCFAVMSTPMLLLLGGLSIWLPARADGQIFAIRHINNISVLTNTLISFQISVTNTTGATTPLIWSLGSSPPAGATITPTTAAGMPATFSWRPTQTQQVSISASVTQPPTTNSSATSFIVTVTNSTPVATAPYLAPISDCTIDEGVLLTFTTFATNRDNTTNALTFSLAAGSPIGASITNSTPTNGLFTWTPTAYQAGHIYSNTVIVTEANTSLRSSRSFAVTVLLTNDCAQYDEVLAALASNVPTTVMLTDCTNLVLTDTLIVTNDVTLDASTAPDSVLISGNNQVRLFIVKPPGKLTLIGLTLSAGLSQSGGAIYVMKGGTVTLNNCIFQRNRAVGVTGLSGTAGSSDDPNYGRSGGPALSGWPGLGGAICNLGTLAVYDCQFLTNSATGGSGGSGGNGSYGYYQGGNGGQAGNGAVAYGGAIYNYSGGTLVLSSSVFSGNIARGGDGGYGGTNGGGVFGGYAGSGGFGGIASGGAVCSGPHVTIEGCSFFGNAVQGGSSQAGGEAGGGYGVNGAPGGSSYGGGACLIGGGGLADCQFGINTATGGNGGDGGDGFYGGGDGGDGGDAVGGCLYNFGAVSVVNCTFAGCEAVGGTNGAAGSGPFSGLDGIIGREIKSGISNSI
ncbi:MAG: hypothetical protein WCT12_09795, partial [Verrucomicrobiota bacterium]